MKYDNVTEAMIDAGQNIASELYDARIFKALGNEPYQPKCVPNADLIEAALEDNCSVKAIYLAMLRAAHT